MKKVPVREQEPQVRAGNFEEVCYGYTLEEAQAEASRCLNCKNAQCMKGCPVSIDIPGFIQQIKEGNIEEAYNIITQGAGVQFDPQVVAAFQRVHNDIRDAAIQIEKQMQQNMAMSQQVMNQQGNT